MPGRLGRALRIACLALLGCHRAPPSDLLRYEHDAAFRRGLLPQILVGDSRYVRERYQHYASGDALDWDRHDAWNPQALDEKQALDALGKDAFFRYPVQPAPDETALAAIPFGVAVDVGGPQPLVCLTCATCHTRRETNGALTIGASNRDFDLGALFAASSRDSAFVASRRAWGPGRVDVSSGDGDEPVAIPDLRTVKYQTHLQYAGAVIQTGLPALAVRVETLIITAHGGAVRPPRRIALALATYLWSLAPPLPHENTSATHAAGAAIFAARCASCHRGATRSGPPVDVALVGTDPTAANSPGRGTGKYRAPSLIGVAQRTPLLHDGSARDLAHLLDPTRPGGHPFTKSLSVYERTRLREFLDAD